MASYLRRYGSNIHIFANYFSINAKELIVGQENLYKDPCDDWLDLINAKLISPNYPSPYEPETFCQWNLTTTIGSNIILDFGKIDVSLFVVV